MFLILLMVFIISGCNGSSNVNEVDETIYNYFSNKDFAYKYPSEWVTTTHNQYLIDYENIYGDLYSSGAMTEGEKETSFGILALDLSSYTSYISESDLIDMKDSFKTSFENNTYSAKIVEESYLTINNRQAIKVVYEYFDTEANDTLKFDVIFSYKGLNVYLIIYGSKKSNYNQNLGIFTEMKDSIELYY